MNFWIFMFFATLLIPFANLFIWYTCPRIKNRNRSSGYRTARSLKNELTWSFAQKECSRHAYRMFILTLFIACSTMVTVKEQTADFIAWVGLFVTVLQLLSFFVIIYFTEKALKLQFDDLHEERKNNFQG